LGVVFVAGLTGLYLSDRALRRIERADEIVQKGQTGLPWIDEFLSRRAQVRAKGAAYEQKARQLLDAVAAAQTSSERIAAHYAVARHEAGVGRGGSDRERRAWQAIVREGGSVPQTLDAWRGLLTRLPAGSANSARTYLRGYLSAIENLPPGEDQLTRLLEAWRISTRHGLSDIELTILETIHATYPGEPRAIEAYEALAGLYRQRADSERLAAVEESIRRAKQAFFEREPTPKPRKG
jgi:hypothetical protein